MLSYGLNVMVSGFRISGTTAVVHTGDAGLNPQFFLFNNFLTRIIIVKVTNSEL